MDSVVKFLYGVKISDVEISHFVRIVRGRQILSLLVYLLAGLCFICDNIFWQVSLTISILAGVVVFITLLASIVYTIYGHDVVVGVSKEVLAESFTKCLLRRVGFLVCLVPFYFISDYLYVDGDITLNVFTIFLLMSFITMYSFTLVEE